MKPDFDNDLDLLLRQHRDVVRRGGGALTSDLSDDAVRELHHSSTKSGLRHTRHLDADELSAYAENALPDATRTHYAAHLADCEQCRKIVVGISMAADVAGDLERRGATGEDVATAAVTTPLTSTMSAGAAAENSWRERLASFFTPRRLAFAVVPVLALLMAAAVLNVVLRTRQPAALITAQSPALNESRPDATAANNTDGQSTAPTDQVAQLMETDTKNQPVVSSPSLNRDAPDAAAPRPSALSKTASGAATAGATPPMIAAPTSPSVVANETAQNAAAPPAEDKDNLDVAKQAAENVVVTADNEVIRTEERAEAKRSEPDLRSSKKSADRLTKFRREEAASPPAASSVRSGADGTSSQDDTASKTNTAKNEIAESQNARRPAPRLVARNRADSAFETRTAAGRRFRRDGGVWIDTAYNASMTATVISRGSEQYRALVADEPELQRIADQLGGEVVVLWKGRAYRIR